MSVFLFKKYKLQTHTNKNKNKLLRHVQTRTDKQHNTGQHISARPPQGTSDIARGVGLLIPCWAERESSVSVFQEDEIEGRFQTAEITAVKNDRREEHLL